MCVCVCVCVYIIVIQKVLSLNRFSLLYTSHLFACASPAQELRLKYKSYF